MRSDARHLPSLLLALLVVDFFDRLLLLFHFHSPILEPDLDLPLGQGQLMGQIDATPPRQIVIDAELLLELERLVARIGLAAAASHGRRAKVGDSIVLHPWKIGGRGGGRVLLLLLVLMVVQLDSGGRGHHLLLLVVVVVMMMVVGLMLMVGRLRLLLLLLLGCKMLVLLTCG